MYRHYRLVLMVTHACNLRCSYCYGGAKLQRCMQPEIGFAAVDRAVRSIDADGTLELSFFGGEPLLEAGLITELVQYADAATADADVRLHLSMTTNGTLLDPLAWQAMTLPAMGKSPSRRWAGSTRASV